MTSFILAFLLALLASALPLAAEGWSWQGAAAVAILTLALWPLVAIMRAIVGWLHHVITGRRAP